MHIKECKTNLHNLQVGHGDCDIVDDCMDFMSCGENNCRRYNPLAEVDADCCQSGKAISSWTSFAQLLQRIFACPSHLLKMTKLTYQKYL